MAIFRHAQSRRHYDKYAFEWRGSTMSIRLPKPVELYFAAENANEPSQLDACVSAHATVLDEGRTYAGLSEIKRWKAETKRKYRHTIESLQAEERGGLTVVKGKVSGDFPGSPVILEFSFALSDDKITSLAIHG